MTENKATIRVEGKIGGLYRIRDELKAALKARGVAVHVEVDKKDKALFVEGDITKDQIEGVLSHSRITNYHLDFHPRTQQSATTGKTVYPQDYFPTKEQLKAARGQLQAYEGQIAQLRVEKATLETQLTEERAKTSSEVASIRKDLRDLEAMCATLKDAKGVLPAMMIRENNLWESFVQFYIETISEASQVYGIPEREFEKACLDYFPLNEKPEFKDIEPKWRQAVEAKEATAKGNPFVKLDPAAEEVIQRIAKMQETDRQLIEVRRLLTKKIEGQEMGTLITYDKRINEAKLYLPFKMKAQYPILELELIGAIRSFLDKNNLSYSGENYNGLLGYKVTGIGVRLTNRLKATIEAEDDTFKKLGGKREVLKLEA